MHGEIGGSRVLEGQRFGLVELDRHFGRRTLGRGDTLADIVGLGLAFVRRRNDEHFLGEIIGIAELNLLGAALCVGEIGDGDIDAAKLDFRHTGFHRHRFDFGLHAQFLGDRVAKINVKTGHFTGLRIGCREWHDISKGCATKHLVRHDRIELISRRW
ncbi:hypothetical protein D3C87_1589890 [compost metagenome]